MTGPARDGDPDEAHLRTKKYKSSKLESSPGNRTTNPKWKLCFSQFTNPLPITGGSPCQPRERSTIPSELRWELSQTGRSDPSLTPHWLVEPSLLVSAICCGSCFRLNIFWVVSLCLYLFTYDLKERISNGGISANQQDTCFSNSIQKGSLLDPQPGICSSEIDAQPGNTRTWKKTTIFYFAPQ